MFINVEDLVPYLVENAGESEIKFSDTNKTVKCYRPRIEGGFSRSEKIFHTVHGIYRKAATKENIATLFGRSKECRIADPEDDPKIFKWLPEFSFDDVFVLFVFNGLFHFLLDIEFSFSQPFYHCRITMIEETAQFCVQRFDGFHISCI